MPDPASSVALVATLYLLAAIAYIVSENRRPQSSFAWLLLFIVVPVAALVPYVLFGRMRGGVGRTRTLIGHDLPGHLAETLERVETEHEAALAALTSDPRPHDRLARLTWARSAAPFPRSSACSRTSWSSRPSRSFWPPIPPSTAAASSCSCRRRTAAVRARCWTRSAAGSGLASGAALRHGRRCGAGRSRPLGHRHSVAAGARPRALGWLLGQLFDMVVVAVLAGLGLWAIGIPLPLALGLIAGLLNFVPYVGPFLGAAPRC